MATTPPALGYGTRGEAPIDAVNQWMRTQPWYQALLASFGQSPTNVHLNDTQKQQVIRAAQANGVVVDEGHDGQDVDDSGNFEAKGHGVRNTLIVAGIAAAALATAGAAGVFGGAAAGAGAGGAGAAAGGAATAATAAGVTGVGAAAASAIPWAQIVGSGASLFGNLFAAHQQASAADSAAAIQSAAAERAAEIQAASAKYAADLTSKDNAAALQFQYANSENAYQNNEAARQGNYGIFAARERRLGPIGEEVGLAPREVPAYVPGVDPGFGTVGEAAGSSSGAPAAGGGAPTDPNALMAALTDNYQKLGVAPTGPGTGPTDIAYMAKQMAATGGLAPNNASYWLGPHGRIAQELAKAGKAPAPAAPAASAAAPAPAMVRPPATATPFLAPTMAAGVPQDIGYYA